MITPRPGQSEQEAAQRAAMRELARVEGFKRIPRRWWAQAALNDWSMDGQRASYQVRVWLAPTRRQHRTTPEVTGKAVGTLWITVERRVSPTPARRSA